MFDLVCGVSTGAILASFLGIHVSILNLFQSNVVLTIAATQEVSLDELERKYKEISLQIFTQSRINGTTNLFLNHSYYDTSLWEKLLQEHLGDAPLTNTNRNPKCPKVFSSQNTKQHTILTTSSRRCARFLR